MLELIRTTTDKAKMYKAVAGAGATQLKDVKKGFEIQIADVIQHETADKDGEVKVCTSIIAQTGEVYQTLSPTVDSDVHSLYSIFGDDIIGLLVKVSSGTSNSGREFLKLDLA